ncbi:MAG TPA: hypothetical protein VGI00_02940 [Streptosporangiaceae bacterium]|jgi:hypothetical protein
MSEPSGPYDGEQTNQARDEPIPASHDDDRGGGNTPLQRVQEAQPMAAAPDETGPGQAVQDMMPSGPGPQGDVPDAPAVQVAGTDSSGDDDQDSRPGQARIISNAVPGKPDGEVDTRS